MALFAGVRLHLFLCVFLPRVSNPWAHRTKRNSCRERISRSRSTYLRTRTGSVVRAYRAVVFERPAYLDDFVLGRHGRFIAVSAEPVATRDAADLFCVLPVVCERGAGFFWLSIGRHATRSGFYLAFLCAFRNASWFWAFVATNARQSVPAAMGMVSHLLRVRRSEDDEWRSAVAAVHGDGRILSEWSTAHMDRLVLPGFTALVPCLHSISHAGARIGLGVDAIFAASLAHRLLFYCDSLGIGRYFHSELHFFELPGADVGSLAAG